MSLSAQQAHSFFSHLKGKTATFIVDGRQTNFLLVKGITFLSAVNARGLAIFDVDAFYSSNSGEILPALSPTAARSTRIYVPEPGSSIETEIARLFRTDSEVFVIESLNTLYHLLSSSGASSSRKLTFVMSSLSYLARTNMKSGLFVMYRRERIMGTGRSGSMSSLSDTTISVETTDSGLLMKCEHGEAWPEGRFFLRLP